MPDHERCFNVDLSDAHGNMCTSISERVVKNWRIKGTDESLIQHVLTHIFPGIPPSFATEEEIQSLRESASGKLCVDISKVQVDGIRRDGLVNLLVNW